MEYHYHISQFQWNKDVNTFFAYAWDLDCIMPDGDIHPEVFPNQKQQFFIDNPTTGGFRRFRFVKEYDINSDENEYVSTDWLFESEDGIKCSICISL
jgi:hypothetical protein